MNIYLTSYGIDTGHREYMNCCEEIIEILKDKKVVIIPPNARLINQNRETAINVQNELKSNNIYSKIIDIDIDNMDLSDCDAIYFTGGGPKNLMLDIYKNNLFNKIKTFIDEGGIVIGQSVDAMIFNKQYLDTTTSNLKIIDDGFYYGNKIIVPHFDHLPSELLMQLPNNILKIKDTDQLIKLD